MPIMNQNKFESLSSEIECPKCNNFGHTANNCRLDIVRSHQINWVKQVSQDHPDCHECNLALQAFEKEEIPQYVDSGCSKHMTGDKERFVSLKKDKGSVMFGDQLCLVIVN